MDMIGPFLADFVFPTTRAGVDAAAQIAEPPRGHIAGMPRDQIRAIS